MLIYFTKHENETLQKALKDFDRDYARDLLKLTKV